jgi:hypothetical protein
VRGRVAPGWKVFVHAEGPQFVNGDHQPARPFAWWRPGQFIRYSTTLVLPRPGTYMVWAGFFQGGKRAPVASPHARMREREILVATIEVSP